MILNDLQPTFQGHVSIRRWMSVTVGLQDRHIVRSTVDNYTRRTHPCNFEWAWMTLNNLANFFSYEPNGNFPTPNNPHRLLLTYVCLCASDSHAHQNRQQSNSLTATAHVLCIQYVFITSIMLWPCLLLRFRVTTPTLAIRSDWAFRRHSPKQRTRLLKNVCPSVRPSVYLKATFHYSSQLQTWSKT